MTNLEKVYRHLESNGFFYRIVGFFKRVDIGDEISPQYQRFLKNIDISMPSKMMRIRNSGTYDTLMDRKRNSGASGTVSISTDSHLKLSKIPGVNSDIKYPKLKSGSLQAWFTPEGIVVKESAYKEWSVYDYDDIQVGNTCHQRIINGTVYRDTKIVDYTWKFVNKKGGPDKRFKDNKKLPIVEYGEVVFKIGDHVFDFCSSSQNGASNFGETLKLAKEGM